MQHNISHKNKSHLIKQTEEAQKRAKRRLIGSIFLLLLALIILLNVTAKMKPVTVAPTEVQIKNTVATTTSTPPLTNTPNTNIANNSSSQQQANSTNSSNPALINQANSMSKAPINNNSSNNPVPATAMITPDHQPSQNQVQGNGSNTESTNTTKDSAPPSNGFKAKIESINNQAVNSNNQPINNTQNSQATTQNSTSSTNRNNNQGTQDNAVSSNPNPKISMDHLVFTPQIITSNTKQTLTPEQILNGEDPSTSAKHYYIQLTASKDQNKISQIQSNLAKHGINAHVQAVKSGNNTIYRLRIGPFNSHDAAVKSMNSLQQ